MSVMQLRWGAAVLTPARATTPDRSLPSHAGTEAVVAAVAGMPGE